MRLIALIVLVNGLVLLSGLICAGIFLASVILRQKIGKYTTDDWAEFFRQLSEKKFIGQLILLQLVVLSGVSFLGFYLFRYFNFVNPFLATSLTFLVGIAKIVYKTQKSGEKLREKLNRLRTEVGA
ncbi:hypothetical protein [Anaerotignum sp.]|uniref:hypothetical protein n=1 Tax=Anaerotignum sp. TaxID=2039241 RepID=UPI0028A75FF3|nr:hypothetical protein [Anaerotignum sp.]